MAGQRLYFPFALVAILGWIAAACGSSSTTLLTPSPPSGRCGVTLDVSTPSIGSAGGTGMVRIQTNRECCVERADPTIVGETQPASGDPGTG